MMRRAAARLGPFVAAAAGIAGFGLLYRGLAAGSVPVILTGLALILIGLDRAGRALAASMMMRTGTGGRGPAAPGDPREPPSP
jgi:hypothetical protein